MKTRAEAHAALDYWIDNDIVGNMVFFRAPHSDSVDCVCERTIKTREMDIPTRTAFVNLISRFPNAVRGEFFLNANGEPDRVKVVIPFDDKS